MTVNVALHAAHVVALLVLHHLLLLQQVLLPLLPVPGPCPHPARRVRPLRHVAVRRGLQLFAAAGVSVQEVGRGARPRPGADVQPAAGVLRPRLVQRAHALLAHRVGVHAGRRGVGAGPGVEGGGGGGSAAHVVPAGGGVVEGEGGGGPGGGGGGLVGVWSG